MLLFTFAVVVLSVALAMFIRLYHALSAPTKTMVWVLGANLILAALYCLFSAIKLAYMSHGRYVPQGEPACHYLHPLARTCQVLTWLGQPIMAWQTLRTIRNQPVPARRLRAATWGSVGISVVFFALSETYMPGSVMFKVGARPSLWAYDG